MQNRTSRPRPDGRIEAGFPGSIAGVDEAGRGPWAGPVVAAAVILDPSSLPEGIDDSKRLSARRRGALFDQLAACAEFGVGKASVEEIDAMNISQATALAMRRAVADLSTIPDLALIDGRYVPPGLPCAARAIVAGDALSLSIAAASIIAKVTRDRIMKELAQNYPGYGWERNAGYGVPAHIEALARLGVTPHHRRSFRPIHKMLYKETAITR